MIRLATEMPNICLNTHGNLFNYEFCLTHMAEQSNEYLEFYLNQNKKGRLVILDNSVFELGKSVSPERIWNVYLKFERKDMVVLVCPDVFGNGLESIKKTNEFIDWVRIQSTLDVNGKKFCKMPRLMAVAQGKDWDEWYHCYCTFADMKEIEIIGATYDIEFDIPGYVVDFDCSLTRQQMWKRIYLFEKLLDMGELRYKWHHLLGSSDPLELYYQSSIPQVKTMDTSIPFVEGLMGRKITETEFLANKKNKRPKNYFDVQPTEDAIKLIEYNIKQMKLWARGRK